HWFALWVVVFTKVFIVSSYKFCWRGGGSCSSPTAIRGFPLQPIIGNVNFKMIMINKRINLHMKLFHSLYLSFVI
ncbi:hypothetical protein, partial [Klebsiella pneumoniae]|uniref:hypothetical protein n=1 Tax=Klebsiella pneumoniae TaxID=573 RepID=UPI001C6FAFE0